jgi:hypothetical protein
MRKGKDTVINSDGDEEIKIVQISLLILVDAV